MSQPDRPEPPEAGSHPVVRVTVARSGGIAGLTRRWSVTAPPHEPAEWVALVQRCPWESSEDPTGAASDAQRGADRFTWTIDVDLDGRSHRAVIPETRADGPWRALIDAVRASDSARG